MKIRKILCVLGLHSYVQQYNVDYLRDEGKESVYKVTDVCRRCGKGTSHIVRFPKV